MALIQKLEKVETGGTHAVKDGTLVDLINPTVPLADTTSNFLRMGASVAVGWVGRGYRDTKSFGF